MPGRKLLAIMFTDIVGYSSSMSASEKSALNILETNRNVLRAHVGSYGGIFRKEIGDGSMSSFPSALQAVACALDIQAELGANPDFRIRIGIHIGDVVEERGDVFGDGVNIASRIEPHAPAGGLCVSSQVAELIRNKPFISALSMGEHELKGIGSPVELFAISVDASSAEFLELRKDLTGGDAARSRTPSRRLAAMAGVALIGVVAVAIIFRTGTFPLPSDGSGELAIAVLPFDNFSHDPAKDYIVDGMTEELTSALAQVGNLRVISRTSVMGYRGKAVDLNEVAKSLGVNLIIEGSVVADESRLRITAQLIRTDPERHIFAQSWEGGFKDILQLQTDVARAIVDRLKLALSADLERRILNVPSTRPAAFDAYLRGKEAFAPMTLDGAKEALGYFKRAIEIDPGYADAFAAISSCYVQLVQYGDMAPAEAMPLVRENAEKAVALDPAGPRSNAALGIYHYLFEWDFPRAESELRIGARSADTGSMLFLSFLLTTEGKNDEAVKVIKEARKRAPADPLIQINVASRLNHAGKAEEALAEARRAELMDPGDYMAGLVEALALVGTGDYSAAAAKFRAVYEPSGGVAGEAHAYLVWLLAKMGDRAGAESMYEEMKSATSTVYVAPFWLAIADIGLDRPDAAMEALRRCVNERDINFIWELRDRALDPLRDRKDWKDLAAKIGVSA